ncbi:31004_t:CDS:2 [Gigaspora margarita]|uniref:31004_t:CDS:1 n=1 Tax=Gigaspora margarita TaxID=4874 RepID=A0ABN7VYY0_GIGMA|nr:31004_t:CDS:2 [Gigaspora margarita]
MDINLPIATVTLKGPTLVMATVTKLGVNLPISTITLKGPTTAMTTVTRK